MKLGGFKITYDAYKCSLGQNRNVIRGLGLILIFDDYTLEVVLKEQHITYIGDPRHLWGVFIVIGMFYILIMGLRLVPLKIDINNGLTPKMKLLWLTLHEKDHKELQYKSSLRNFRPPSRIRVPL